MRNTTQLCFHQRITQFYQATWTVLLKVQKKERRRCIACVMSYLSLLLCVPYISRVAPNAAHLKTTGFTLFIDKQNPNATSFTPSVCTVIREQAPMKINPPNRNRQTLNGLKWACVYFGLHCWQHFSSFSLPAHENTFPVIVSHTFLNVIALAFNSGNSLHLVATHTPWNGKRVWGIMADHMLDPHTVFNYRLLPVTHRPVCAAADPARARFTTFGISYPGEGNKLPPGDY